MFLFTAGHKISICGDAIDEPSSLCVQHSPALPFEFNQDCISKVTVSSEISFHLLGDPLYSRVPSCQALTTKWFKKEKGAVSLRGLAAKHITLK